MNIVVLDGFTLNPGDLDWSELEQFGTLTVHDRTKREMLIERCHGAEILFTNKTVLDRATLLELPKLRYIGVLATGYNVVDIDAARERGIVVTNVPGYGAESVAQMVFAHILNITNNVAEHAADVRSGGWQAQDDFCYTLTPQIELSGKMMGIVGYGDIGKATARLAAAFGMRVAVNTRTPPEELTGNFTMVDLDTLFSQCDVISLHCPLTSETHHMINAHRLAQMKESAILINCSRGPLIDEVALKSGLEQREIFAAGIDVLEVEPPKAASPLYHLKNCHITPHIAWATKEARARLLKIAIDNVAAFLRGTITNQVN